MAALAAPTLGNPPSLVMHTMQLASRSKLHDYLDDSPGGLANSWSTGSIMDIGLRSSGKFKAGAVETDDLIMTSDEALMHLRRKIGMQMSGGSHGLMRCWVLFRTRAGSSKDGINYKEFCHGLRSYGLPLPEALTRPLFDTVCNPSDRHIHVHEFIDKVMGRWAPSNNTHFGGKTEEEINGKKTQKPMVHDEPDATLTTEAALNQLRRAISQRLKSGPNGLMRCWIEFRHRSGGTKDGISAPEFARGLAAYGIKLMPDLCRQLHQQMDTGGDGLIQIHEFIDKVMGRWSSEANTHFGGRSEADIAGKKAKGMVVELPDEKLTIEQALPHLRRSIAQRLKSGPNGLMRCWIEFRLRAGSTKEGITLAEFSRGLKCYGIPLTAARTAEFFQRMDSNGDGYIHISEFVDEVMGRWDPTANSGGASAPALDAIFGGSFDQNLRQTVRAKQLAFDAQSTTLDLCAAEAVLMLRAKISQRLAGGSHGLQRAWKTFRSAGGGSHAGVTRDGLERALRHFGLPVRPEVAAQVFNEMDAAGTGLVHEDAFAAVIMGRPPRPAMTARPVTATAKTLPAPDALAAALAPAVYEALVAAKQASDAAGPARRKAAPQRRPSQKDGRAPLPDVAASAALRASMPDRASMPELHRERSEVRKLLDARPHSAAFGKGSRDRNRARNFDAVGARPHAAQGQPHLRVSLASMSAAMERQKFDRTSEMQAVRAFCS
ncbi:hypothetical protein M885DRAFT_617899 [Pelagophyceae sp. CCMP2097]|nr:hypothetical protein M885DRAFT_617899 [Pelagophyceae sp. CCMP2097]|mmetsp:Transcript_9637/g.33888  ORF Transcript_9637/g.33888 Transcript_9637/m.33888 type:complete len:717 (+) Transcript_9637:84-2234(+)